MGEIFGSTNRFASYSIAQLSELLEDDDKLNEIVKETDEVSFPELSRDASVLIYFTVPGASII